MSLEKGYPWQYQDLQFQGYSLAGITTSILFKTGGVLFDVGQGMPFQNSARFVLLSHGHLDHAAGIPYLIAQKYLNGQKETQVYAPPGLVDPLSRILAIWRGIDEQNFPYRLEAALPGEIYHLNKLYCCKPFRTRHRVESQGYIVYHKKRRLRAEHRGKTEDEIRSLRSTGQDPGEETLEPLLAFTGDTESNFLDSDPDVARARVLFVEVTFWDERKSVADARRWGHIHFDELLELLPRMQNEKIVLIHTSIRYSLAYLREELARRLPREMRDRVELFPRPD